MKRDVPIKYEVLEVRTNTIKNKTIDVAILLLPLGNRTWINTQKEICPYSFEYQGKTYYISEQEYQKYKEEYLKSYKLMREVKGKK